jgi:hypothetical protein
MPVAQLNDIMQAPRLTLAAEGMAALDKASS